MNTFYTAFDVLKKYITEVQKLEISTFSLMGQAPDRVIIWVTENEKNFTHFVCIKMSCTQFLIWGYDNNYQQILSTGYDYADVNTPNLHIEKPY